MAPWTKQPAINDQKIVFLFFIYKAYHTVVSPQMKSSNSLVGNKAIVVFVVTAQTGKRLVWLLFPSQPAAPTLHLVASSWCDSRRRMCSHDSFSGWYLQGQEIKWSRPIMDCSTRFLFTIANFFFLEESGNINNMKSPIRAVHSHPQWSSKCLFYTDPPVPQDFYLLLYSSGIWEWVKETINWLRGIWINVYNSRQPPSTTSTREDCFQWRPAWLSDINSISDSSILHCRW